MTTSSNTRSFAAGNLGWAGIGVLFRVGAPSVARFFDDQRGAAMIEYSVLITIVAAFLLMTVTAVAVWSDGKWDAFRVAAGIGQPVAAATTAAATTSAAGAAMTAPGNGKGNNGHGAGNGGSNGSWFGGSGKGKGR